jgi:hypothetical protein
MAVRDQLVPIEEAGRRFGVPYRTLRKRVVDQTIRTFCNDRDRRVTLVALDDVAALFTPRPTANPQEVDTLSAA